MGPDILQVFIVIEKIVFELSNTVSMGLFVNYSLESRIDLFSIFRRYPTNQPDNRFSLY